MRCVAIDDEPMALAIIEQYCQRRGDIALTTFSNPQEGLNFVADSLPDLLFLDIEMGATNGVEAARSLPDGVMVIFTTAYAQFAIDGFDLNAVDFLHKPFSYTRFERAVSKAELRLQRREQSAGDEIVVKIEYQNVRIALSNVIYIESMDNYVRFHMRDSRPMLSQMSLKSIEEMLPGERFMRVHKSFIVSRAYVTAYTKSIVSLRGDAQLPIGRTYQSEFNSWIHKKEA